MPQLTKLFGPPGTGKTTKLLSLMEEHMAAGVKPQKIGFISFTKKAAGEAKERAMTRFGVDEDALPYFRTIHSLVFRQLGVRRDSMMQWRNYRELGAALGLQFQGRTQVEDGSMYGMGKADRIMFIEGLARARKRPLLDEWRAANEPDIDWFELERFSRALVDYKRGRGMKDFNDILQDFRAEHAPYLDVLILDEAQDLTPLQWDVFRACAPRAGRIYVAGDDDQAIYNWSGADVNEFLGVPGEVRILDQSYRVPAAVHKTALSISGSIHNRQPKTWKSREEAGSVRWHPTPEDVDLSAGEWLLLARNGYMLAGLEEMCMRQGVSFSSVGKSPLDSPALKAILLYERMRKNQPYSIADIKAVDAFWTPWQAETIRKKPIGEWPVWFEAFNKMDRDESEYFRAARRRGESLTKKPRIEISTIHAAKGGEADNVLLMTDVSAKSYEQYLKNSDDEHRVMYVGVTRTKQNLHLIEPKTLNFYPIQ